MDSIANYTSRTGVRLTSLFALRSLWVWVCLVLALGNNIATASTRHALVIGNSNYGSGFTLKNPQNDAIAIAEKAQHHRLPGTQQRRRARSRYGGV